MALIDWLGSDFSDPVPPGSEPVQLHALGSRNGSPVIGEDVRFSGLLLAVINHARWRRFATGRAESSHLGVWSPWSRSVFCVRQFRDVAMTIILSRQLAVRQHERSALSLCSNLCSNLCIRLTFWRDRGTR